MIPVGRQHALVCCRNFTGISQLSEEDNVVNVEEAWLCSPFSMNVHHETNASRQECRLADEEVADDALVFFCDLENVSLTMDG